MNKNCCSCVHNEQYSCLSDLSKESIDRYCKGWKLSEDYYYQLLRDSSWYVKEKFLKCNISLNQFYYLVELDLMGIPIVINLYDAIEKIYGFTTLDLAEILEVPVSTINYSRGKQTPEKWIKKFSKILCIPERFFYCFKSDNLNQLEKCKDKCFGINALL